MRKFWLAAGLSLVIHGAVFGLLYVIVTLPRFTPPQLLVVYGDSDRDGLPVDVIALNPGTHRKGDAHTPGGDAAPKTRKPVEAAPGTQKPKPQPKPKEEQPKPVVAVKPTVVEKPTPRSQAAPVASAEKPKVTPKTETASEGAAGLPGATGGSRLPLGTPSAGGKAGIRTGVRLAGAVEPPQYPPEAREAEQEGIVVIGLRISAQGKVVAAKVDRSSGFRLLDNAALEHARRLQFIPAQQDGVAIEVEDTQKYTFRLPYS